MGKLYIECKTDGSFNPRAEDFMPAVVAHRHAFLENQRHKLAGALKNIFERYESGLPPKHEFPVISLDDAPQYIRAMLPDFLLEKCRIYSDRILMAMAGNPHALETDSRLFHQISKISLTSTVVTDSKVYPAIMLTALNACHPQIARADYFASACRVVADYITTGQSYLGTI